MVIYNEADPQQLVSFKAPSDLVKRLERACRGCSCTKSSMIRQLLHYGLNQLSVAPLPVPAPLQAFAGAKADA